MSDSTNTNNVSEAVKEYVRQEIQKAIADLIRANPNFQPPGGN